MKSNAFLFLIIPTMLLFQSCGSTDTVTVVPQGPRVSSEADSSTFSDGDFKQLNIGLIEPVTNFDPLFITDLSTMRVLSLIYEGLFTLDTNGEPQPALVDSFNISDDGLEYTFTLNRDIYFHNSTVFNSGIGRRVSAEDVKLAFDRTASANVPSHASNLLMNVLGYENYLIEQHNEYDSSKRVIESASGIEVINPETFSITLKKADRDFLNKLASPYLFIYPSEAVDRGLQNHPVGTGHYSFNSIEDERITLVKHETDRDYESEFNRIDFIYRANERELFRDFARNLIDWIPETSPSINTQLFSDEMQLLPTYDEQYDLLQSDAYRLTSFYVNLDSKSNVDWLQNRFSEFSESDIEIKGTISFEESNFALTDSSETTPDGEYFITNTTNPVTKNVLTQLNSALINPDSDLTFLDIRVVIPETSLYSKVLDSFHRMYFDFQPGWLFVETPIFNLFHSYLSGIKTSTVPWLIDIESIQLDDSERQSL